MIFKTEARKTVIEKKMRINFKLVNKYKICQSISLLSILSFLGAKLNP